MPQPRALTAAQVAAIKIDGNHRVAPHLYLQIRPQGSRSWLFRFSRLGKTAWLGLGAVADVPLTRAREEAERLRVEVRQGHDPLAKRRAAKAAVAKAVNVVPTFEWCAAQYIAAHEAGWRNAKHREQWESTLRTYARPVIGKLPVDQIAVEHVLKILKSLWLSKPETATRLRGRIERVLGWATALGHRSGDNPARWTGGELPHLLPAIGKVQKVEHHAAVPYPEMPTLVAQLRRVTTTSSKALQFTILTAARTGETLGARWDEIDMEARVFTIPGSRMKAGQTHRIPLSDAAIELLMSLPRDGELVFPGAKPDQPMSNMTMIKTLRTLRDDKPTVHGFRSSFRDWVAEKTDHPREVAEMCLAHTVGSEVEQAYLRTDHLAKRAVIMAEWAAFLA